MWHFALSLMEDGDYDAAATEFSRFVQYSQDDPLRPWAEVLRGISLGRGGSPGEARSLLLHVLETERDPQIVVRAELELAKLHFFQHDLAKAKKSFERLRPNVVAGASAVIRGELSFYLGWIAFEERDGPAALRHFGDIPDEVPWDSPRSAMVETAGRIEELPKKSPLAAGILAAGLPGAGHAYLGRWSEAAGAFLLCSGFGYATYQAFRSDLFTLGGISGFFTLSWYGGNIFGAVNHAHKFNRDRLEELAGEMPLHPGQEFIDIPAAENEP